MMGYHIEASRFGFKELPERILVREDGAYGAGKEHGEPIIDYWYVPEQGAPQAALEARVDELCAENARLRTAKDTMRGDAFEIGSMLVKARDENVKLREYAAKAWSLFVRHGAVHTCDLSEIDAVRDGLRSLGIEAC